MRGARSIQICLVLFLHWSCNRTRPVDLRSLLEQTTALQREGSYQQALAKSTEGISAAEAAHNPEWLWRFRLMKWEIRLSLNQQKQVASELPGTIPLNVSGSAELEARRRMIQARALYLLEKRAQAAELLDSAAELARETGPPPLRAEIELLRGYVVDFEKDPETAEALFRSAAKLSQNAGDRYLEANSLGNIAFIRLHQSRYEEAMYWFEQTLAIARETKSRSVMALSIDNLGWCYYRLGEYEKAARHFEEALPMFGEMGKQGDYQIALGNIGSAWFSRGDYPKAIDSYKKALAVARKVEDRASISDWLINLAAAHIEIGDFAAAEAYNEEARSLPRNQTDRHPGAWLAVNAGRIAEHRGQTAEALRLYRGVLADSLQEPTIVLEARANIARLTYESGDAAAADLEYRQLLDHLQLFRAQLQKQESRISWLAALMRFYRDYVGFLWQQGRKIEALEVAESSRARVLAERLGNKTGASAPTAARLMSAARRAGCNLASYWLAPRESYLWVVTPQGIEAHTLPGQAEIAQDVAAYRRAAESLRDLLAADNPAMTRLSKTLLGPLRNRPTGCVLVSPDQELNSLNFEMLVVDELQTHYWVEETEVRVVPSIALSQVGTTTARSSALLIGDPVSPNENEFPALRNSGPELDFIEKLWQPNPVRKFVRESATPQAYRSANPNLFSTIHISAHAVANHDSPLDSAIILSRAEERYSLTAREISTIPVNARLVTISACHSAGSRSYAGEGTIGFAWAFLHAGAHNVIAGLWAVDDSASYTLMQRMYEAIHKGATPAKALRQAKLSFIQSASTYRKPFYWAPFQVYTIP